ncbi:cell division transport system permease protein [Chryseobacterium bernardetii]|jgi:cell division transport system permease protein|uniref:Cell division protein FtsX n=2 Tax=Chryseobacterium TaxID=59732 RepID=A0A543EGE2_9FLAO|nr:MULTISPECIES: permease-like cell division protein FtsX [Chryseobacterium]MDR6370691.1 cell division transport system permease protein [Chryseobacterium vietnamense]MDR6441697.1 cell division transport system permease protein [Chryseobacterium bernardetii]MDR6485894.1 cell division transport system permease protein [Chryseobacterium vietnamense]TQM20648.1 cell division transport system permease protein [Chryseobacterium aquifrigidense]
MAKSVDEFNKKRLRSSNITVVISIALVLFLLGLMGLILINAQKYSDYIKEQLVVNAYFDENYDAKDSVKIAKLEEETFKKVQLLAPVKKATYISRDMAAKEAKKTMGIDSDALFEENIFPSSIEVALKPEFVDPAKIDEAIKEIKSVPGIIDVKNDSTLMVDVYNNLSRILKWILGFSVLFLILAVVLINNSIRLKIFSKRFIIKTMQLVGAKRRFILKPFIVEAIILGAIGSLIGLIALGGVWYYFTSQIGSAFVQDNNQYFWLVILVLGVGIFISVLSTIFATWRFLKSNVDDLYYS